MRIHTIGLASLVLLAVCDSATASCSRIAPDDAVSISRAWWEAFSRGDVSYLNASTANGAAVTLNNGHALNREQLMADAATHTQARVSAAWSDEVSHKIDRSGVAVTARVTETVGTRAAHYRYLSVLQCKSGRWQLAVAQSTRELHETIRVPTAAAGSVDEFAGEYVTSNGRTLRLLTDAAGLLLVDPAGSRTVLEPIGPALFEARGVSVQGLIRFSFVRNADGAVVALNRITTEVITFRRIPLGTAPGPRTTECHAG